MPAKGARPRSGRNRPGPRHAVLKRLSYAVLGIWLPTAATAQAGMPAQVVLSIPVGRAKIDMTYVKHGPENAAIFSGSGALISYCPTLACVLDPDPDHQRAAALFASTTKDDGHSEEQTVAIETTVRTGFHQSWAPGNAFQKGDNVVIGNAVYRALNSGRSATSGSGPSGKGEAIMDGSVLWSWINDAAIDAKVGMYNEMVGMAGGGAMWGQANNVQMMSGLIPTFAANTEFDLRNDAALCVLGKIQCYNLFLLTNGRFENTASIYVGTSNTQNYAAYFGLMLAGEKLASIVDLEDDSSASIGIGLCADHIRPCTHSTADIEDSAVGPVAFSVTGNHTRATVDDNSTSPVFASIGGNKQTSSIHEHSNTPIGLELSGNYARAQISGRGWAVAPDGSLSAKSFRAPLATPVSSRSHCIPGEFTNDVRFYYVCTAPDHWRRAPLSDF